MGWVGWVGLRGGGSDGAPRPYAPAHRLLHHLAELPRENQLARAAHHARLNEEQLPAHRRPRQPHRDAATVETALGLAAVARRAEDGGQVVRSECERREAAALGFARRRVSHGEVAADRGDLALEVAHASLARVPFGECFERGVGQ